MDEFSRYFSVQRQSGAAGDGIEAKRASWHFYDKMSFIKPYMNYRRYIFSTYYHCIPNNMMVIKFISLLFQKKLW